MYNQEKRKEGSADQPTTSTIKADTPPQPAEGICTGNCKIKSYFFYAGCETCGWCESGGLGPGDY